MRKLLLIIFIFIVADSCTSHQDTEFNASTDKELSVLAGYLNDKDFEGTFVLKDGTVSFRHSKNQPKISKSQIETLLTLKIKGVTHIDGFTLFVTKGWKGNNFGYLLTTKDIQSINGIDKYRELPSNNQAGKWYYVNTHLY